MKKRDLFFIISLVGLLLGGCVKETYNIDKISGDVSLSPTFGLPAFSGVVTLEDVVGENDTIVFDADKFVRFVFSADSAFNVEVSDIVDINTLFSHDVSEPIGVLKMSPFTENVTYTLDEITSEMDPVTRDYFVANNHTTCDFPPFGFTSLQSTDLYLPNFEHVVFSEGTIDITLTNTLPVTLDGVHVTLYDAEWYSVVGSTIYFSAIDSSETKTASIDLGGSYLHNSVRVEVQLDGSPGASGVYIDLADQGIDLAIKGKGLKVESGRFIVPPQELPDLILKDTLNFENDEGIEIEEIVVTSGNLQVIVNTDLALSSTVSLTLPTALRNGVPFTGSVTMELGQSVEQEMSIDNTVIDLTVDPDQPYNLLPYEYTVEVNSAGQIIDFNSNDMIRVRYSLNNNNIDYIRGYFGAREEEIPKDTLDLGMEGLFSRLSGSIYLADPSITLSYTNSIGIPFELNMDVKGIKDNEVTSLNYAPFTMDYPIDTDNREVTGSMSIDNTNSAIADIISSIPDRLIMGGSVRMYPDGCPGSRNSYLFGNSKIEGDLTFNLPLEFRFNNLQFTDTLDNFFNNKDNQNNGFNPENDGEDGSSAVDMLDNVVMKLTVDNGFPLGLAASIVLYDSITSTNLYRLNLPDLIAPAPVNTNGKVISANTSVSTVELDDQFFEEARRAHKIIVQFTLNTTGTDNVKIYSDYSIGFKAAVLVDANLVLSKKEKN
ncbi:MAG TPA: hypothetical protein GXZ49_07290 [Bacteroidetes bacterium]|nr:hypothetical protein [Bacteroidota bacterium]